MKISTKLKIKVILKLIFLNFFLFNSAYAYLDPGTGSCILQAIIAFFAAAIAFMSGVWIKIKMFFKKLLKFNKKVNKDNKA